MKTNSGSDFFNQVWELSRLIPHGKVTTYGAIARYLGAPGAARMVGWAMNQSHVIPEVPAHRVVNRKGQLTGKHHFYTETLMEDLLASEGVAVENNCILHFDNHFWDPSKELL